MQTITVWNMILRLAAAMAVGIIVGGQRTRTSHPAGLRTHMLVAIGAAVVMIIGSQLYQDTQHLYQSAPDPARLGAQVISGVGFLGAGTILKDGVTIRGLTTAASLWSVACLGLAAGLGYFTLAFLGSAAIFITLSVFDFLQAQMERKKVYRINLKIECSDLSEGLEQIHDICNKNHALMQNVDFGQEGVSHYYIKFRAVLPPGSTECDKKVFLIQIAQIPAMVRVESQEE